jgi:hypothetical protein
LGDIHFPLAERQKVALVDHLKRVVASGSRSISSLEQTLSARNVTFASEVIPTHVPATYRPQARENWFNRVEHALRNTDLVFADPDNGLEPPGYKPTLAHSGKSIRIQEIQQLAANGRTVLVYHHQTRWKGGHLEEIRHWAARLRSLGFRSVDALRAPAYSPRVFFLINASEVFRHRAELLHRSWGDRLTWHPDTV